MKKLTFAVLMLLSSFAFADSIALTAADTVTITFTQPGNTNTNKTKVDKFWAYCPAKNSATNELLQAQFNIQTGNAASGNPSFISTVSLSSDLMSSQVTGLNVANSKPVNIGKAGDVLLSVQTYGSTVQRNGTAIFKCVGQTTGTAIALQLMPTVQGATVDMTKGVIKAQIADNYNY